MRVIVGVPRERLEGERRVALVPAIVRKLVKLKIEVHVEAGAGLTSACSDTQYTEAGARIQSSAQSLYAAADLIARVQPPSLSEIEAMREGTALIAVLQPYNNLDVIRRLAARRISSFSLDFMPRITRAQNMDVLSSMSTVSGYKAVLIAANHMPKFFPMLMTAAGTVKAARVLILGAGVAGLQAIATARRLGAVVEAFDIRAAAREQVESLGARFIAVPGAADAEGAGGYAKEQTPEQLAKQRELVSQHMAQSDAVICTALVPGRRAPILMTAAQVKGMRPGSLVVDIAAEQGGNCELTRAGETVDCGGVLVYGPVNLPSSMPADASQMFAQNVGNYLAHLVKDGNLTFAMDDEVTRTPLVTHQGEITHPDVKARASAQ
jgi:H+-translocating NAD(P) transhydrogenase subunit alpha